ncbi:MAG: hypothetical protein SFV81_20020 [Pirellulaceae bacterium]|nr:hypothetical protein [Pirellulaceae bacterium]
MVGWAISRLAGLGSRVLGASKEEANAVRFFVSGASTIFDPIGGTLGMVQAAAAQAGEEGSEVGRNLNKVMNVGSIVMMPGLDSIADGPLSIEDSQQSS